MAVVIEGPKWCGKTTTAEQIASSIFYMDEPSTRRENLILSEINPSVRLKGEAPRLIDEWQLAPKLWDAVRFEVDHRKEMGQFILTCSAVPVDTKDITHSGTGRFTRLTMRPMSLFESGDSSGDVSLRALFDGIHEIEGQSRLVLDRLAFLICRGGWPQAVGMKDDIALNQAYDYYDAVIHLRNSSYGLIENKLGGERLIKQGAETLKALASKLNTEKMKQPSFLMVLIATGNYAYRRKDGVEVIILAR